MAVRRDEERRQASREVSISEIHQAIGTVVSEYPSAEAIWLFGSYARAENRRTSDIDLAVMVCTSRAARDSDLRAHLIIAFEDALETPVDIVLLHEELPPPLMWEILARPIRLWARDAEDADAFASGLRAIVREEWPRLERRWERAREWFRGETSAPSYLDAG